MRYRFLLLLGSLALVSCQTPSDSSFSMVVDHAGFNRWLDQKIDFSCTKANFVEAISAVGEASAEKDGFTICWLQPAPSKYLSIPLQHISRREALQMIANRFSLAMEASLGRSEQSGSVRWQNISIVIIPLERLKTHTNSVQSTPTRADGAAGRD